MKTVEEVLQLSAAHLSKHGVEAARRQAEELLAGTLGVKRLELYMDFQRPLTAAELDRARERLARRAAGEPLAYIEGQVDFYGRTLKVTPSVLIPRPETELLVDRIARTLKKEGCENKVLWDICCGSGCLAIALKHSFPELRVIASDISADALAVARDNAALNGVDIEFRQGDLLGPFAGEQADYVLSNPPYIADAELLKLDRDVRDFEPRLALAAGSDGLDFYTRLGAELADRLKPQAQVWLEIGAGQAQAVASLFDWAQDVQCDRDWSGHDRFVHIIT